MYVVLRLAHLTITITMLVRNVLLNVWQLSCKLRPSVFFVMHYNFITKRKRIERSMDCHINNCLIAQQTTVGSQHHDMY